MKRQIRTFTVRSENNYNNNYGVIKVEERELEEKKNVDGNVGKSRSFFGF